MEKTPYPYEFLWKQLELFYKEVRKKKYKSLLDKYLFNKELRNKVEKLKDKKTGRNYEGGLLERTASTLSIALCIYDNYPEIDIDLILTAGIMDLMCKTFSKKECYQRLKEYPELLPFLFIKKRKKPSLELTVYDGILKLDRKIFEKLKR
ncbi:hypothetical protein [Persephonella sp.]